MKDTTNFFRFYTSQITDSGVSVVDSAGVNYDSSHYIIESFFQHSQQDIIPILNNSADYHWFIYVLLFFALGVALLWYFIPERLSSIFSLSVRSILLWSPDKKNTDPGILVSFFFWLNSLVTLSFLVFYVLKSLFNYDFAGLNDFQILAYIAALIVSIYVLKMAFVSLAGFLFNTSEMAGKQRQVYFNFNNTIGVILLPLLFLLIIIPSVYVLYVILCIVAILFMLRWAQIISLGISISHFNIIHLILYLCTLEIIPMVVLFKIFM